MTRFSGIDSESFALLLSNVKEKTKDCETLEQAAQFFTDVMYEQHSDSFVLARVFATVPFGELPAPNRRFVTDLVTSNDIMQLITDNTLVLSLLGTRGFKAEWNDRHNSRGHVGIPLASAVFVDKVPMMSRLLKQVGLDLDWMGDRHSKVMTEIRLFRLMRRLA